LRVRIKNLIESRQKLRELFSKSTGFDTKIITNNPIDMAFITNVVSMINENIADSNINVELLADQMSMSRSQLYRKIKALTNQSAHEFITTIRLKKAAEMLLTSNLSIADIAFQVGYPEPGNFARVFVKQYGQTPKDYTKIMKDVK
jgi:AraC-like DNA-binding protein